ncbi:hypothetical protein [Amycolatopsis regifaucium]|uniref:Uncharacterized protein n=1 Tax=Amycolatopsis regifaucium TaxID=546365 RepID=A0A154M4Y4_9PSEU|nr:hypothetical protein [Amycolatopsis regifaucium]KZB79685.1 hypothetical protein AVL48_14870 [Amycolatopsis regifaucium]OKA09999.1 hypothetical protein ATP06_0206545 [Amycolatopsis regifaucium]
MRATDFRESSDARVGAERVGEQPTDSRRPLGTADGEAGRRALQDGPPEQAKCLGQLHRQPDRDSACRLTGGHAPMIATAALTATAIAA